MGSSLCGRMRINEDAHRRFIRRRDIFHRDMNRSKIRPFPVEFPEEIRRSTNIERPLIPNPINKSLSINNMGHSIKQRRKINSRVPPRYNRSSSVSSNIQNVKELAQNDTNQCKKAENRGIPVKFLRKALKIHRSLHIADENIDFQMIRDKIDKIIAPKPTLDTLGGVSKAVNPLISISCNL